MTEHAAWRTNGSHTQRITIQPDGGCYLLTAIGGQLTIGALTAGEQPPIVDSFTAPAGLAGGVPQLADQLADLGRVGRLRNSDLWDAVCLAIMRQVIRAAQSKKLYRAFCDTHGETVLLPDGSQHAVRPSPKTVLSLGEDDFAQIGLAFKRRPLQAAAEAFLSHHDTWQGLPPQQLVEALQSVHRIGPWTARAAVADYSNDWALYPYEDLAVRTWAGRAAPAATWPTTEADFAAVWSTLAGPHLSELTLLTLAWGSQHGDIG